MEVIPFCICGLKLKAYWVANGYYAPWLKSRSIECLGRIVAHRHSSISLRQGLRPFRRSSISSSIRPNLTSYNHRATSTLWYHVHKWKEPASQESNQKANLRLVAAEQKWWTTNNKRSNQLLRSWLLWIDGGKIISARQCMQSKHR